MGEKTEDQAEGDDVRVTAREVASKVTQVAADMLAFKFGSLTASDLEALSRVAVNLENMV